MHDKDWQNTLGDLTVEHVSGFFFFLSFLGLLLVPFEKFQDPGPFPLVRLFLCTPFNHLSLCWVVYNSPPVSHAAQEAS